MLEKDWFGIIGFSTLDSSNPFIGTLKAADHYIYQSGGITYVEMLEEARKLYPEADAVVGINIDYKGSQYWILFLKQNPDQSTAQTRQRRPSAGGNLPAAICRRQIAE
jgi:hypothetical protein